VHGVQDGHPGDGTGRDDQGDAGRGTAAQGRALAHGRGSFAATGDLPLIDRSGPLLKPSPELTATALMIATGHDGAPRLDLMDGPCPVVT
jgi:hypothetical protein